MLLNYVVVLNVYQLGRIEGGRWGWVGWQENGDNCT